MSLTFQNRHKPLDIVIVANGEFPSHPVPLTVLRSAEYIICCDGSLEKLLKADFTPDAVVGDMDSLPEELQRLYSSIIYKCPEQENNDLTKAVFHAIEQHPDSISIVGATGLREDHTIGNISLLSHYRALLDTHTGNSKVSITLYSDTGKFFPITGGASIGLPTGSSVSIFSLDTNINIRSKGLRYPLDRVIFDSWWKATLNEVADSPFELIFETGRVILYAAYEN